MNPDLYGTWLTAGDWVGAHWLGLAAALAAAVFAWAVTRFIRCGRDDYRTCNDRAAADRIVAVEPRPEPGMPGSDNTLLEQCWDICPDLRKEERP